jgi:FkbM family methyltransferase
VTEEEIKDRDSVWERIEKEHPEFTREHDVANNYHAVREIVLSGSATWAGANGFFKPQTGKRVMDLGANGGIYTAFCAANGAHVTAYEPHPVIFSMLSAMLKRTGLIDYVEAINAAVWTYTGECPFIGHVSPNSDCTRYNGGIPTNGVPWTADDFKKALPTKCVSFDDAIGNTEWDCVKFDVEGAECEILLAASLNALKHIKFAYVEFHPWVSQEMYDATLARLESVFKLIGSCPNTLNRWEAVYLFKKV